MTAPPRRCEVCDRDLPAGSRADRRTDTARCRKALSRLEEQQQLRVHQFDALRALVAEAVDELDDHPEAGHVAERLRAAIDDGRA